MSRQKTHLERITGIKRDPRAPLTKTECLRISRAAKRRLRQGKVPKSEIERAKYYANWYEWRANNRRGAA